MEQQLESALDASCKTTVCEMLLSVWQVSGEVRVTMKVYDLIG